MATIWVNPGYSQGGFSRIELRDIAISVGVLAAAFTIIYARANTTFFSDNIAVNSAMWFATSLVIVSVCFLLHEFGHKFVAQKYGAWAEYRMFPQGLGLCLLFSFFGFLFAAPGAVYIRGYITDEMNGKISIAGPAVNIGISTVALILCLIIGKGLSADIFFLLAYMNAFLAVFNLLPIPPLDGSKVLKWDPAVYAVSVAAAVALLLITFFL
jgi:Zn-dependent proteases